MIEIWRAVVGYEGLYQMSSFGRVKSLERVDRRGKRIPERLLKPVKNRYGYLQLNLHKNGKVTTFKVHRLVGMVFPDMVDWTEDAKGRPFNKLTINHLNEVKTDNRVENLQWCPLEYNLEYGTGRERAAKTKTNGKLSKPVYQYTLSGEFVREWPSTIEIQRQTGWNQSAISACCRNVRHYHSAYGYIWSYTKK